MPIRRRSAGKRASGRARIAAGATARGRGGAPLSHGRYLIRPARPDDIPAVTAVDAGITSLAKASHWRDLQKRSGARDSRHFFLVAAAPADPDTPLGFIVGEVRAWEFGSAPCGWVYALGIAPNARGFGVGEALLEAIAREFRRLGISKMRTMVAKQNTLPMLFFRAEGMMAGPYIQLEKDLG